MTYAYSIRPATPADAPLLPAVELAAATLFLSQLEVTGLTAENLAESKSAEDFAAAQQAKTPGLQALVAREREGGLRTNQRVVMRFDLS